MALIIAGCGGSSSSSSTGGDNATNVSAVSGNKFAKFGEEASAAEREAASKVLERNLRARAAGNWAVQCASLTPGAIARLEEPARLQGRRRGCAHNLKLLAEPIKETRALRADTLTGSIDALRVNGDRAIAVYHGNDGKDYGMPMKKVAGQWKVDALLTTEAS